MGGPGTALTEDNTLGRTPPVMTHHVRAAKSKASHNSSENSEDPCGSRDELGEFPGVSRTKQLKFFRVLGQQKTHLKIQGKDLHDLVSGCHHFLIHDPEAKAVWESRKRLGGRKLVKLCRCSQFLTPPVGISCYRGPLQGPGVIERHYRGVSRSDGLDFKSLVPCLVVGQTAKCQLLPKFSFVFCFHGVWASPLVVTHLSLSGVKLAEAEQEGREN